MLRFLLIAACCFFLCGCKAATEEKIVLVWATNQHPSRYDAVRWFEKEHPDIKVRIMPISDARQFYLQCLYGDAPDVITFFSVDLFQNFVTDGLLKKIEYSTTNWPYYEALKEYCIQQGTKKVFALPQVAYPYLLYFNPSLVDEKKVKKIRDWDDLLILIKELVPAETQKGKKIFGLDIHSDILWFLTWYYQRGGRFFGKNGKIILNVNLVEKTLKAMEKWRSIPSLIPEKSDRLNLPSKGASRGVLGSLFLQGRSLFYWSGSWKIADFEAQDKVSWRMRLLPSGPVNDTTLLGGNSFAVSKRAAHPQEAELFVRYLAGVKAQQRHLAHKIYLPAHKKVFVEKKMLTVKKQLEKAHCPEYLAGMNSALFKEILTQVLESHRLGRATPVEAALMLDRALQNRVPLIQ